PTGDVFEGITAAPIAYTRARGYEPPRPGLTMELGGPWAFYRDFWSAHDIGQLAGLYSPEPQVPPHESLWVPLLIHNEPDYPKQVVLRSTLPQGWTQKPDFTIYPVAAHSSYPVQLTISPSPLHKGTWQTLTWNAESEGQKIGTVRLHVSVASNGL